MTDNGDEQAGSSVDDQVWPPTPEQITGWLGGFDLGHYREIIGEQPSGPPELVEEPEPDGLFAALVEMAKDLLVQALGGGGPVYAQQRTPVALRRVVLANGEGLQVRGCQLDQTIRWLDVDRMTVEGSWFWLHTVGGDEVRLPCELRQVERAARQVVSARAHFEGALAERMERGLSRPEGDEEADRGLSLAEE